MPRQKQPIALQKLSFDYLVRYTVDYCHSLSIKGLLTQLHQAVAVFKNHVKDHVPRILFAEFCRQFLDKFHKIGWKSSKGCPASHNKAALKMIFDVEFAGLIFGGEIARYVDHGDAHRIKGMRTLNWGEMRYCQPPGHPPMPTGLENYCLQDLTTFIYPQYCTDLDLEIIGPRCWKLEVLKIQESRHVTDRGLRALRPCTKLRIINLHCCSVSDDGVNELLNSHEKLEEFNVGTWSQIGEESYDILSRPVSLVCPSVKRFAVKPDHVTNMHLHSIVALFPNLTYLEFCTPFTGDLRILKDLKSLAELDLTMYSGGYSMENLKELLTSVGANISRLTIECDVGMTQNDLNFISKVCGNVEVLYVTYSPRVPNEKLIMPPFQRLKHLHCIGFEQWNSRGLRVELEFCKMLSLEILKIQGFENIFQSTESMMLDNVKFPNLKEVRTFIGDYEHPNRIMNIAKNHNLDFKVRFAQ